MGVGGGAFSLLKLAEPFAESRGGTRTTPRCYYHPDRETNITCGRCERPLCADCVKHGATGVRCEECLTPPPRARGLATTRQVVQATTAALVVALAGGLLLGWLGWVGPLTALVLGLAVGSAAFYGGRRHRDAAIQGAAGIMALVGLLLAAVVLSLRGGQAEVGGVARTLVNLPYARFILPAIAAIVGAVLRFLL